MTRATLTAALAFLCSTGAAAPPVTFESPCECRDNHRQHRWSVKNDPWMPSADANEIQSLTPSDIFSWPGQTLHLTQQSGRTGIENNWYALTGRVVTVSLRLQSAVSWHTKLLINKHLRQRVSGGIRTPNPLIRSQMLYPVELQTQRHFCF
jgi:hypothetical protein